ncbi:alpha/beta fold hydrolase [Oculatella sp. LEGE 06141]|uniref:alpha/beta hydrolase n=1 Tax=Oculatella sp. LEGE 06141 TaxID=1828648 RepID=UPI0018824C22|nr:alpha/beta fold hydrolase [Oculatella sp. LEGE 06141]MBE9178415.1 alpha/beta fold hydrolase [Oculatella sp. LEGE 06141]
MLRSALVTKLPLTVIGVGAIAYFGICLLLFLRQTRLIFFPSAAITTTPADLSLAYEDVWLPISSGDRVERLHGWWIPAQPEAGVVLYLHGNGVNIGANAYHASRFHQMGFSVLLIDYRGYGQSEGRFPSEQAVYQDAEAAWTYLTRDRQIPAERILIYGHSLGGAIAIDLALKAPNAAGLIVQSSFTSIRDMVNRVKLYRLFPADVLLHQRFDSIRKVRSLQLPVLFIHGTQDVDVPHTMSEALYEATPSPKQLHLAPGAGHNDVADVMGDDYLRLIEAFAAQTSLSSVAPNKIGSSSH